VVGVAVGVVVAVGVAVAVWVGVVVAVWVAGFLGVKVMTTAKKRRWLSELSAEVKTRPTAAFIYGPAGIGKSSAGAATPKPAFLIDDKELGIHTLKANGLVAKGVSVLPPVVTYDDVIEVLGQLATEKHDHRTLVIDTLGGIEGIAKRHCLKTKFGDDLEKFQAYGKGWEATMQYWREVINALDVVRNSGMSIVCLAHSVVKTFKNPEGEDYDRYLPDLNAKTWALTSRWVDLVVFCNYVVATTSGDGTKAKGSGGRNRVFNAEWCAAFEAKNRMGLPPEIDMGESGQEAWGNLVAALKEAKKEAE